MYILNGRYTFGEKKKKIISNLSQKQIEITNEPKRDSPMLKYQ